MNLTTATPSEIDTALAEIYDAAAPLAARADSLERQVAYYEDRIGTRGNAYITAEMIDQAQAKAADAADALALFLTALDPFNAEYIARGRWTRAFLCLAAGGHVHRSQACSTTFRTTQFGWLPQVSGHDEAEIVAASGADACTVCYPSAPVESLSRPRTLLHLSEVDAQARREALAARKAELAAKRTAAAITATDGSRLVAQGDRLDTVTAAKGWLTREAEMQNLGYRNLAPQGVLDHVAAALAAKLGTTVEAEHAAAAKRAAKRR